MQRAQHRSALIWSFIALLVMLCGLIAVLQYSWVDAISRAERERLRGELGEKLNLMARAFNEKIASAVTALSPASADFEQRGDPGAYAARLQRWRESKDALFTRVAVAQPSSASIALLEETGGQLHETPWPPEWLVLRDNLLRKLQAGEPGEPYDPRASQLLEIPRFGPGPRAQEREWLLAELNLAYLRDKVFPELIGAFAGTREYSAKVFVERDPGVVIYASGTAGGNADDESIGLLRLGIWNGMRGFGPPRGRPDSSSFGPPRGDSRWRLSLHHRDGSLEGMVARARWRNLATSGGILLLIVVTASLLVELSRQREQLAALQMNFVAGVSHELRTPLTVIRTLAFNLSGDLARKPDQVEKYGAMIRRESERLGELVEQVLLFARTKAGQAARERSAFAVKDLIEDALKLYGHPHSAVQVQMDDALPPVMVDGPAIRNALRNLFDNAEKYSGGWLGVTASAIEGQSGKLVEIRVADHGPGIPEDEQTRIFDAFYRGRRALADQIHGTGLGLHLTKAAIEANGGTIRVSSEPGKGTEFVIRIPVA